MRKLPLAILAAIAIITLYINIDWSSIGLSLSSQSLAADPVTEDKEFTEPIEPELWIDTVMYAEGHSFGYSGDVSMWGGWYFDTIPVGDDIMLNYDSAGPSKLKLNLITRELNVDLNDTDAPHTIRQFLNPREGFTRFHKDYEVALDSTIDEEYGTMICFGNFSLTIDYADSCQVNAAKINRFLCDLTGISESETTKVPGLSAFYAGFNQTKYYRPVYTGNVNNMLNLSDFLANKTFENWKRGGDTNWMSNGARLEIRSHVVNSKFVTVSKYEYERIGIGHGMYTETFHTLDLDRGTQLSNKDIFKTSSLDNVKLALFEVIANDFHFREWNPEITSADMKSRIEGWQAPNEILKGTEWEEPETEFKFELPDGALTDKGIIFSFQPYEIDCWAAGAFHFIVPYNMLMPYLSNRVKSLIK